MFQPSELKGVEVPVKCIHSATTCDFKKQNKIYQNDKGELDPFYRFTKFHLLFQEENGAAWISWLLDAIHKIKVKLAIRFIDFFLSKSNKYFFAVPEAQNQSTSDQIDR